MIFSCRVLVLVTLTPRILLRESSAAVGMKTWLVFISLCNSWGGVYMSSLNATCHITHSNAKHRKGLILAVIVSTDNMFIAREFPLDTLTSISRITQNNVNIQLHSQRNQCESSPRPIQRSSRGINPCSIQTWFAKSFRSSSSNTTSLSSAALTGYLRRTSQTQKPLDPPQR
jgi:hypothetical protein